MMDRKWWFIGTLVVAMGLIGLTMARAAIKEKSGKNGHTDTIQSSKLYTDPDPTAGGGLHGIIASPAQPMDYIFALSQEDYTRVYRGEILGNGHEFRFTGLPVGKYDLFIVFPDCFYEGLVLYRGDNALTAKDISGTANYQGIEQTIQKATAFFDTKKIHRLEGETGRAAKARCVLQELRTRSTTLQSGAVRGDIQIRSLKLALLEDVNIGWSLENTREILRQEVAGSEVRGLLPHHYSAKIGNFRVIDSIKELGTMNL